MLNLQQAVDFLRSQIKIWDAAEDDLGVILLSKLYGVPARMVFEMLKGEGG
jgi:hypothetical protein